MFINSSGIFQNFEEMIFMEISGDEKKMLVVLHM